MKVYHVNDLIKAGVIRPFFFYISMLLMLGCHSQCYAAYKNYNWHLFSMRYPDNWKVVTSTTEENGAHIVRLENQKIRPITLVLYITPKPSKLTKKYQDKPNLAAFTLAYPTIHEIIGKNTNRLMLSINQVQVADSVADGMMVMSPVNSDLYIAIQTFVVFLNHYSISGMLITDGVMGEMFTEPYYYYAVNQAYSMLKSIKIYNKQRLR